MKMIFNAVTIIYMRYYKYGLCGAILICIFSISWAIIGFVVYDNYSECHDESIAKMTLAWSIIYIVTSSCTCMRQQSQWRISSPIFGSRTA